MTEFEKQTDEWRKKFFGARIELPCMNLDTRLRMIESKMPRFDKMAEYPALKQAYEEYKIMEKLIVGN